MKIQLQICLRNKIVYIQANITSYTTVINACLHPFSIALLGGDSLSATTGGIPLICQRCWAIPTSPDNNWEKITQVTQTGQSKANGSYLFAGHVGVENSITMLLL